MTLKGYIELFFIYALIDLVNLTRFLIVKLFDNAGIVINNAVDKLKKEGYWVYGLELGGEPLYKSNLTGKICLVIGGEDSGVKRLTKEKCDAVVSIPMFGKVNSLNASVACGIAVYEVVKQRLALD